MKKFPAVMLFGIMVICTEFMLIPSCLAKQADEGGITVEELQCEYAKNPLGIDTLQPRFSWILESNRRGQMQSAYHILVASSAEKLERGIGDKWDSGKVASEKSVNVPYQGKSLASEEECYWKVRVWDKDGKASAWSEPAAFEMGLIKESDWQGQWIGMSEADSALNYIPGRFGQALNLNGKSETVKIEHYPELKPAKEITISAWIKPNDDFSDRWQEIYRKEDDNARCLLAFGKTGEKTGLWFGLGIDGAYTEYCGPLAIELVKDGRWHLVAVIYDGSAKRFYFDGREIAMESVSGSIDTKGSSPAYIGSSGGNYEFFSGGIDDIRIYSRALSADEIKGLADGNIVESALVGYWKLDGDLKNGVRGQDGKAVNGSSSVAASPLLRREFEVSKKVRRARVYISGLGWYELYINGKKVGDHVLDPATTDYHKRVLYATYDVTDMVKTGQNAVGVMLGNGWFSEPGMLRYGDSPRLLVQMNIEFTDGTSNSIKTDQTWKTSGGPITRNDLWGGETYDARLEKQGWKKAGCDDSGWAKAVVKSSPGGRMVSQLMPAIKVNQIIKPVKHTNPKLGVYVYDMGQLFGGWARIYVKGPEGTEVSIKYSEGIFPDSGLLDKRNHPTPLETDYYILKGDPKGETYEPRFTYHPVRYVQIEGYPGKPTIHDLEGRVVCSSVDMAGDFECSNPLLNQIHRNVVWTFTNGLFGIPLDCLHREHWAWTDPATVAGTLYPRKYMPLFWTKWLQDIKDAQRTDGAVPDICPSYTTDKSDPAWGGNYPILLCYLYQYYEDKRLLEEHYEGIKHWLEYLSSISDNYIVTKGHYGDHMLPGFKPGDEQFISKETPPPLVWTGYYYRGALVASQIATVLGKNEEAGQYADLAERIKEAYNQKWLNKDTHQYATGSQTANFLPLALGIIPEENKAGVVQNLVNDIIEKYQFHHHTGNTGTTCMIDTLTEYGRGDIMYKIATQTTYPGWGYMVSQGATTIWENWGLDQGEESMIMWATIDEFFYNDLAGIKGPDYHGPRFMTPGFRQIEIKPYVLGDLTYASGSIKTVRGMVSSSWKIMDDSVILEVTIPVNSEAKVCVPKIGLKNVSVKESNKIIWENGSYVNGVAGIYNASETDCYITFDVGSGSYAFRLTSQ
jgi:alpha-L-rhamnosidase